jgi:hypothetical protein
MKAKDFIMSGGGDSQKKSEEVENEDLYSAAGFTREGTSFLKELIKDGAEEIQRLKAKFSR